ncbi:MAG: ABC transporter ATP-binding protein [Alphaproteobacteria bacterium]|nr:ABC transporter ATP-binding protein [Alphaproteobacteria bacterium]
MTELLEIRDLKVGFNVHGGWVDAVRGISLRVRPGTTVALVGESGSGKSVVSQCIMSILPTNGRIRGGKILFRDPLRHGDVVDIAQLDPESAAMRDIRGGRISIVFQEPMTSLSPLHTVGDQVGEALMLHRECDRKQADEMVVDMLRLVGFPHPVRALKTYPFELSGGLRQRAMIAMALVCRPALLIADEPTTALDVTIQAQILKLMRDLQKELGMAVLIITHDLGVVANVAEEVVVMYHGEVMERGTVEDIFENPGHPYLKALLNAVPRFEMAPGERLQPLREIKVVETGHLLAAKEPWPATADKAEPLLRVTGLGKTFHIRKGGVLSKSDNAIRAVNDVEFVIERGECLGLVGESGSGKTTVSKMIMGAISADSGEAIYNDRGSLVDLLRLDGGSRQPYRRKIQFIFQDPFGSLNPRMTVYDIVSEPLIIHRTGDERHRRSTVRELMELVGLDPRFLNRYPHSFSGGQRQRIGIARALALQPDLLICDEPVSALDVSIQAQILNLLKDLQEKLDLTYLFISHNLAVVEYIADRIAVMCAGNLVEVAPRDRFFREAIHPYTKALLTAVPDPDLNHPLDFEAVVEGRTSDPSAWAPPFTIDSSHLPGMIDLGDGHQVRAADDGSLREAAE